MILREIWNKFTEVTFGFFETSRVKRVKFSNLKILLLVLKHDQHMAAITAFL